MRLDLEKIKEYKPGFIQEDKVLKGAVCIALTEDEKQDMHVLFEVRSSAIKDQPGDICFPGGRVEEGELPETAAVRELCEELLVSENDIEIVGKCDIFLSETMEIYPFVGLLKNYSGTFSSDEVEKVFTVPLEFFVDNEPEEYIITGKVMAPEDFPYEKIRGGRNYKWRKRQITQYFYQYGEYCIWGLTARIMRAFVREVKRNNYLDK